jgi:hypothetical protein
MKVEISRSQQKGKLGRVMFESTIRLVLTPAEEQRVRDYKLGKKMIAFNNKRDYAFGGYKGSSINDLVKGVTFKTRDLAEMAAFEDAVSSAVGGLKDYIEGGTIFDGSRQVVEF